MKKAEQYLSFPDFCERFSITRRTLYRWMADETFPTPVVVNKRRYFKLADIEKWELQRSGVDTDLPADIDGLPVVSKVITDYNQFADALRKRREAMKITCAELDMLAGMQEGYSNKLENHHRPGFGRGVGKDTFPLWIGGLRVGIILVDLPRRANKFKAKAPPPEDPISTPTQENAHA